MMQELLSSAVRDRATRLVLDHPELVLEAEQRAAAERDAERARLAPLLLESVAARDARIAAPAKARDAAEKAALAASAVWQQKCGELKMASSALHAAEYTADTEIAKLRRKLEAVAPESIQTASVGVMRVINAIVERTRSSFAWLPDSEGLPSLVTTTNAAEAAPVLNWLRAQRAELEELAYTGKSEVEIAAAIAELTTEVCRRAEAFVDAVTVRSLMRRPLDGRR